MSELKAGVIVTPHDEGMCFNRDSDVIAVTERETKFYLKSEADKVIAHNKYKRCLAMAEMCSERFHHYTALSAFSPNKGAIPFYDKMRHNAYRWKYKWLELAEKFKEIK